jgi:hypothetical protein
MSQNPKKARSPYAKYNKRPYQYSETYRNWKAAVIRGDRSAAARLGRQHTQRFLPGSRYIEITEPYEVVGDDFLEAA